MEEKKKYLSAEEKVSYFSWFTKRNLDRKKKFRLILTLLSIVVALIIFFSLVGNLSSKKSKVPSLIGKNLSEAKKISKERELTIKVVQQEYREDVTKGKIIRQRPAEGEYINKNEVIEVALSLGIKSETNPNLVKVPPIEGLSYEKAKELLSEADLKIQDGPSAKSIIVIQSPQPWERAVRGSVVNIIVDKAYSKSYSTNPDDLNKKEGEEKENTILPNANFDVIRKGNKNLKRVALTLDDGWNYDSRILDLLETYGLKITVFIVGGRGVANENPDFIRRMDQAGFEVCTHTYSHYVLSNFSDEWIQKDIKKGQEVISSITNKSFPYMRPSGGIYDQRTINVINEMNYKVILWSADLGDISPKYTTKERVNRVLNNLENGTIIVGHFSGYGTYEALKELIPEILERGYEITTVSKVLEGME